MAAPYASDPLASRGRRFGGFSPGGESRGPRDAFQRDRDRIIHSISFRRLRGKTQVFVAPDGDHFRVRLTHSLEVAQIARTIARALGLNEDLTEAIALAHDIGHPPFGHAGEAALKAAMRSAGGFDHNAHTIRVLTRLDSPYPRWPGLNLSWETLEGLAKHNGPVRHPGWALAEADADHPLELGTWPSLEAQVAAIADDIAYDNHDIDDGLRAGVLRLDDLLDVPFVAEGWARVRARFPDLPPVRLHAELVRDQIGAMVNDVLAESRRRIAESGVSSADDVRAAPGALIAHSPGMAAAERELKRFMYRSMYHLPRQRAVGEAAGGVIAALFERYLAAPMLMPEGWRANLPAEQAALVRHVGDFVAGMTDRYAIARHEEVIGPASLPPGF
jgi:dGTPase